MAWQIGTGSVGGDEQVNRAGRSSGSEASAIGGPAQIDHVVVKLRGPVFGELHED
jgi:hypothetical protein